MLSRLRHTYGFGVHSPSAYTLVKEVLTLPGEYGYYGYWDIETSDGSAKEQRRAKLLLRLIAHIGIRHLIAPSEISIPYQKAISAMKATLACGTNALKSTLPGVAKDTLLFLPHGLTHKDFLQHWLDAREGALLIFGLRKEESEGIAEWIMENLESGIVLDGRHRLIAFHRPDATPVRYKIL